MGTIVDARIRGRAFNVNLTGFAIRAPRAPMTGFPGLVRRPECIAAVNSRLLRQKGDAGLLVHDRLGSKDVTQFRCQVVDHHDVSAGM